MVTRRAWTELPTPPSVIERVHLLAKGMRAFPIFTDRTGHVIGDVTDEMQYDDTVYENVVDPAETPGVHTEETQAETT